MLSYSQQRLWFIDNLTKGKTPHSSASAMCFTGDFNAAAFERALNEIVKRHEMLRTRFVTIEGRPVQVIDPHVDKTIPVVDLQNIREDDRFAVVKSLCKQDGDRRMDLSRGPLLRAMLLKLAAQEHVLCLTLHHIVT